MTQSKIHIAIIMDGNGRWAQSRALPRTAGHVAGATALRRTVEAAGQNGAHTLTLYAFSSDNWKRPPIEVRALMALLVRHLSEETARCLANGVRLNVIGRRDRLPEAVRNAIAAAERATRNGRELHLRLAIDYSARDSIVTAAQGAPASRAQFSECLGSAPDVDLLIRTGGEQRLSDFLLWESAYAELYFTPTLWPDFTEADLKQALTWFRSRERRFGAVPVAPAAVHERWLR